jgi:hypothetical protein
MVITTAHITSARSSYRRHLDPNHAKAIKLHRRHLSHTSRVDWPQRHLSFCQLKSRSVHFIPFHPSAAQAYRARSGWREAGADPRQQTYQRP